MYHRTTSLAAAFVAAAITVASASSSAATPGKGGDKDDLGSVRNIVVIYAENRSFDNLFGRFPGANGLANASRLSTTQLDRDGSVLPGLPAVWGGTDGADDTTNHAAPITQGAPPAPQPLTEAETAEYLGQFNHPFSLAALYDAFSTIDSRPLTYTNRDLYHRFYENQMQINGGANNKFAAWADSGGLVMMYIPTFAPDHPLWQLAKKYTLADNFFQSAFGGSYLNHQYLICSCAPIYPAVNGVPTNPNAGGAAPTPSAVEADGVTLDPTATSPASALNGPPAFVNSSVITAPIGGVFYSVNTSQPPFPPSGNANATQTSVDLLSSSTVPPQTQTTIGDLLEQANVSWSWYAGAWDFALSTAPFASGTSAANPNFQYHHQPFNYYAEFDPSTAAGAANRAAHLKDAGVVTPDLVASGELPDSQFYRDIVNGNLPAVTFYKPQGTVNEHSGYANVTDGDRHIAAVVKALQSSPQYAHMVIVITYDENGGIWDHVAPPKADAFGPGSRIPAIIVSPFAKRGFVDHTQYDTTSILRLITRRYHLPVLAGIKIRDNALIANGYPPMGDLTKALDFGKGQGQNDQGQNGHDQDGKGQNGQGDQGQGGNSQGQNSQGK